jgi:hypothetical protein
MPKLSYYLGAQEADLPFQRYDIFLVALTSFSIIAPCASIKYDILSLQAAI